MDILAHALWTNALYEGATRRRRSWREIIEIIFWSDFPDIFSFGVLLVLNILTLNVPWRPEDYLKQNFPDWLYALHHILYSLPLFFLIFFVIWAWRGKPYLAIGGWFVHIFIDIFTHTSFFPPHFLWPFSDFHLELISWVDPTFVRINYSALLATYFVLYFFIRKWRHGK